MLNQEQFQGKWDEIKGGVRNLWGKISEEELDQTHGNMSKIRGMIQEKYGESHETVQEKLDTLMSSFENDTDKSLKLKDGESSYQRNPTGIRSQESESSAGSYRTGVSQRTGADNTKNVASSDVDYDSDEIFDEPRKDESESRIARH